MCTCVVLTLDLLEHTWNANRRGPGQSLKLLFARIDTTLHPTTSITKPHPRIRLIPLERPVLLLGKIQRLPIMETSQDDGAGLTATAGAVTGILIGAGRRHSPISESLIQHLVAGAVNFVDRVIQGSVDEAHFEGGMIVVTLRSELQPEAADVVQIADSVVVGVLDEVPVFLRDNACEAWCQVGDCLNGLGQREGVQGIDVVLQFGSHGV